MSTVRQRPTRRTRGAEHPGPPLAAPVATAALAWVAGALLLPLLAGHGPAPDPTAAAAQVARAVDEGAGTAGWTAALLVLGGAMLVAAGGLLTSRLTFLAPHAPGPLLAGLGAVAAGVASAVDGALVWATSLPGVRADTSTLVALHAVDFVVGGPVEVSMLGVATVGLAVATLYVARTPRWLSIVGVVLGVVDLLTWLTLAVQPLAPVLPVTRVLTLVWLVTVCALVPRSRGPRGRGRAADSADSGSDAAVLSSSTFG